MADRIVARVPMRVTEEAIGVDPIDSLLHRRGSLVERVATLRSRYGSFGTFDHERKMELARLAALVRVQALRDKLPKLTVAEVDDAAHSHPDYREFITQATKDRADLYRVEAQIDAIDATIQRANAIIRYRTSEARL